MDSGATGSTTPKDAQEKRVQDFKNILQRVKQREVDKKASERVRERKIEKMK